jgi:ParB family transcriptional regulator, chromosome partitioning protein
MAGDGSAKPGSPRNKTTGRGKASGRGMPLGRGLAALLGDVAAPSGTQAGAMTLPIERLSPAASQPRHHFSDEALAELAASIKAHGIIQPLVVRERADQPGDYEIIAGERRWRAAQLAGLDQVPVVSRELTDQEALAIALVENLQREDLSPIEEAEAFRRLLEDFGLTQDSVASLVGKSRPQISNTLRLLRLPPSVRDMVSDGRLSAGHARALVNTADPEGLAERIVREGLTVRDAERLAQAGAPPSGQSAGRPPRDPNIVAVEDELTTALGLKAALKVKGESRGSLTLHYSSLEQLDGLLALLHGRMN